MTVTSTQLSPSAETFRDLDRAHDRQRWLDFLAEASMLPAVQEYKELTHAQLRVGRAAQVLDVGCGLGDDARRLAALIPDGTVVGVDASITAVQAARARSLDDGARVRFCAGSVYRLPFPDCSFDAVRADRVLHFLNQPARAIAEMKRVLRAGGRLVVSEPDNDSLVIDAGDRTLTARLLEHRRRNNASLLPGIGLGRLFAEAGLTGIELRAHTGVVRELGSADRLLGIRRLAESAARASVLSPDEASGWLLNALRDAQSGHFAVAMSVFIASGTKP
jgi:SAM-dependent methyltransferase